MGRSTRTAKLAASAAPIVNASIFAGEPVQRGDVILQGADSKGWIAALPNASAMALTMRPPAGGPQQDNILINSATAAAKAQYGSGDDLYEVIKLNNGNIAVVWIDTAVAKIKASVYNQDGAVVVPETALSSAVPHTARNVSAVALAGGGFAVGFVNAASGVASPNGAALGIYDNSCNLVQIPVATDAASGNATLVVRIAQLANGNIVSFATSGTSARFSIYSLTLAQVKAATQVYTNVAGTASGSRTIGVAALTGGGFAVAYNNMGASSATMYAQVYTAVGAAVGAAIQLNYVGTAQNAFIQIVGLTGGGFAAAAGTSSGGLKMTISDKDGNVQGGGVIDLGRLNVEVYGNQFNLAAAPNGDVGVAYSSSTTALTVARYAANGNVVVAPVQLDSVGSSANIAFNADNTATVVTAVSSNINVYQLTAAFAPAWPTATIPAPGQGSYPKHYAFAVSSTLYPLASYMTLIQANSGAITLTTRYWRRQAMTLVGVANYAAAKDAPLSIQVSGQASLRVPFPQPWATNQQGANPPGQKMNVVGSTATLQGVQAATTYPLN